MGENLPETREAARRAVSDLVEAYREAAPAVDAGWRSRVYRYAGLTMLYRLCGSSPAPYLSPARHAAIRAEGIRLLMGGVAQVG